jgi:hypothetical protein
VSGKAEFKAGCMMVGYNIASGFIYTSIGDVWSMALVDKDEVKLLGSMVVSEVLKSLVGVVFEVSSTCL